MKKILLIVLLLTTKTLVAQVNLIDNTGFKDTLIHYHGFNVCYLPSLHLPLYTSYRATKTSIHGTIKRELFSFKADRTINSIKPSNYRQKGYDMGHLTPAEDMSFSKESMSDCMYTSNIVPQVSNFNRGVWKSLEEYINKLADQYDSIYVYTGVVYGCTNDSCKTNSGVVIPDQMWKLVIVPKQNLYGVFILPNVAGNSSFWNYEVTWDEWIKDSKVSLVEPKDIKELNKK